MKTDRSKKRNGEAVRAEGEEEGRKLQGRGASSIRISAGPQWGEGEWDEKESREERMKVGVGGEGENEELPFASLTSLHRNKA